MVAVTEQRDETRGEGGGVEPITVETIGNHVHQQNVKTSPGPPRGVMVPLVLLVHPDPPWSTFSVKFQKAWITMDRSGPGGPRGPQPPLVDQERSGPAWTTLRHFPDACVSDEAASKGSEENGEIDCGLLKAFSYCEL